MTLTLGGCATRPINAPIAQADHTAGYRYLARTQYLSDNKDLVILAFSVDAPQALEGNQVPMESPEQR